MTYVVTLVHGTFARNAAWTKPDSYFSKSLRSRVPRANLVVRRFNWSGWNSPWARTKAVSALRRQLADQLECYPDAQHYVIGHSHGGAVALQAVYKEGAPLDRIAGVATLATPYIHLRRRSAAPYEYGEMVTWLCFLSLAGGTIFGIIFTPLINSLPGILFGISDQTFQTVLANVLANLGYLIAAAYLALAVARALSGVLLRLAEYAIDSLQCSPPGSSNLLIVRTGGDEATALLASSQLYSWVISRIWRLVGKVLRPIFRLLGAPKRAGAIIPAIFIILFLALLLALYTSLKLHYLFDISPHDGEPLIIQMAWELGDSFRGHLDNGEIIHVLFFIGAIFIGGFFAIVTCLVVPVLFALSVVLLPFGAESALAALLVEISVEVVPLGAWTIHQFGPIVGDDSEPTLMHSASYQDNRVIKLIADWIVLGHW